MKRFFQLLFFAALLWSCARVGSPVGGDKDTVPPTFLGSNIDSPRTRVPLDIRELRLEFDEYITLKDFQKNFNVSPPITRIKKVLPSNLATKFVSIQWEDTLQANTTYNFNFGNAIQDNNEGNPLPYFNYAFSTGDKIDSLYISGDVNSAYQIKSASGTEKSSRVVGLYKDVDTIDYKKKPYYLAKVDEDGYFELNYLAPGKYRLIAFQDENGNSVFDAQKESVGFVNDVIVLEKPVSGMQISMYPSKIPLKYKEMKEVPGGVLMLFEGNPEKVDVRSISEKLKDYRVTHQTRSDSVRIWFDAKKQDIGINQNENLRFGYDADGKQDTVSLFYRMNEKNEMVLNNEMGNAIPPKSPLKLTSNYIIDRIEQDKWTLTQDSTTVQSFTAKISETNPYEILVSSDFKEGKKYRLTVPKSTVHSYYESNAVSKRFDFEGDIMQNYGSFTARLTNKPAGNFWLQLLNTEEKVMYSTYTSESEIKFPLVKPGEYFVRLLSDENGNNYWDRTDFSNGKLAEPSFIFFKRINVRPLWELVEDWDLQDKRRLNVTSPAVSQPARGSEVPRTTPQPPTSEPSEQYKRGGNRSVIVDQPRK